MELIPRPGILLGDRRTSVFNRIMARSIDLLVAVTILILGKALWWPLGVGLATAFCALSDGFGDGQSIGKRILGLRVEGFAGNQGCDPASSIVRNLPFALAVFLASTPLLWLFFLLVALPLLALEGYLLFSVDSGVRLGDVLGNTQVVEQSVEAL